MMKRFFLALIGLYQIGSIPRRWIIPQMCRFYPSCSNYMKQAIEQYGAFQGLWLGLKRVARCHPLHPGGLDPVPVGRANQIPVPAVSEPKHSSQLGEL